MNDKPKRIRKKEPPCVNTRGPASGLTRRGRPFQITPKVLREVKARTERGVSVHDALLGIGFSPQMARKKLEEGEEAAAARAAAGPGAYNMPVTPEEKLMRLRGARDVAIKERLMVAMLQKVDEGSVPAATLVYKSQFPTEMAPESSVAASVSLNLDRAIVALPEEEPEPPPLDVEPDDPPGS